MIVPELQIKQTNHEAKQLISGKVLYLYQKCYIFLGFPEKYDSHSQAHFRDGAILMRPVQGVFRHIVHEHVQPILEDKLASTTMTGVTAMPMEPPWQSNKVDDVDVLFQASSSSEGSKCALIVMAITVAAAVSIKVV